MCTAPFAPCAKLCDALSGCSACAGDVGDEPQQVAGLRLVQDGVRDGGKTAVLRGIGECEGAGR